MTIYEHSDPRGLAFLTAGIFIVLFSIRSLNPMDFFTYIPVVSGSLVLALYGIHASSPRLIWPAMITTGLLTLMSLYMSILSAPYLTIPHVMCKWDQCKGFLSDLNNTDSEYANATEAVFRKTISCYLCNVYSFLYFIPFLCTLFFGLLFLLLKNSQSWINRQQLQLPREQEGTAPIYMPLFGLIAFIISLIALVARYIVLCSSPQLFTTAELIKLGVTPAFVGFCITLFCYADLEKAAAAAILLFSFLLAFVDYAHSCFILVSSMAGLSRCPLSQLKAMNVTVDVDFSPFYSWNITAATNNTDFSAISVADISCFGDVSNIDFAYCYHLLTTTVLLISSFSFWMEILFSEKSFLRTTKKIIQRGF